MKEMNCDIISFKKKNMQSKFKKSRKDLKYYLTDVLILKLIIFFTSFYSARVSLS